LNNCAALLNVTNNTNMFVDRSNDIVIGYCHCCIQHQKKGKPTGPDGFAIEPFMYESNELLAYLSIFLCFVFEQKYVPDQFMQYTIMLEVKDKTMLELVITEPLQVRLPVRNF
jgi:hypothetical protein